MYRFNLYTFSLNTVASVILENSKMGPEGANVIYMGDDSYARNAQKDMNLCKLHK